jgi:hypothetical protein
MPSIRSTSLCLALAAAASAHAQCVPDAPAWIFATDNLFCDLIVVDWDTSSSAFSYKLYRSEIDDFSTAISIGDAFPSYYDYNVAGNVGYYYWAVGSNDCGDSAPSYSDVGYSNFGLSITDHPDPVTVRVGGAAAFSVGIRGFGAYEWFRDGEPVQESARITGVNDATLRFSPVYPTDAGEYYVQVYGGCGTQISDAATLTVLPSRCPIDFNFDGFVDFFDYDAFVDCFERPGACPYENAADFNADGFVDFFDYDAFVNAFELGC